MVQLGSVNSAQQPEPAERLVHALEESSLRRLLHRVPRDRLVLDPGHHHLPVLPLLLHQGRPGELSLTL